MFMKLQNQIHLHLNLRLCLGLHQLYLKLSFSFQFLQLQCSFFLSQIFQGIVFLQFLMDFLTLHSSTILNFKEICFQILGLTFASLISRVYFVILEVLILGMRSPFLHRLILAQVV